MPGQILRVYDAAIGTTNYTVAGLSGSGTAVQASISLAIVPQNPAIPCDVSLSINKGVDTNILYRESLAAGDTMYVSLPFPLVSPNTISLTVTAACDVTISGAWS